MRSIFEKNEATMAFVEKVLKSNKKFKDTEFPPEMKSLVKSYHSVKSEVNFYKKLEWRRASEIYP